ncbi:DarT ssDNA thymidine ADP-ribosyltransferase family protein [Bacteroides sp.]|uniref:DarT ssDNA thymidine ADP-ribosyltransferase family protein n=1 Tax=Bacteroides sp. TaxID=29523 RepID=UPI0026359BCB|nr:DarT ssDNA thymidine ADP-ribosyltransferase family protein [Bacteroides sp.]MDD3041066.1 DarT ssDNA thymidine ADP-ribosyltransferase family protein [Bacteroides sp.]
MEVDRMRNAIRERGISWLLHFTRADNLESIMRYGLLTREQLSTLNIEASVNDNYRYDGCENAICLSIEFPNYKMFYRLRQENPSVEWAVLFIDPIILVDHDCAYCHDNAGSERVYSIPLSERRGFQAFERMFAEIPFPTREELDLEEYMPTNPQAEVLVFESISITYIKRISFNKRDTLNAYRGCIPTNIRVAFDERPFYPRNDYRYWR